MKENHMKEKQDGKHLSTIVSLFRTSKYRLICIDFDQTLISIHTNGQWDLSSNELCQYIRPFFYDLVPELIQAGFHIALITFSSQIHLIQQVLQIVFPQVYDKIWIYGNTNDFLQEKEVLLQYYETKSMSYRDHNEFDIKCLTPRNKCFHIAQILMRINQTETEKNLDKSQVFLFDDDPINIRDMIDSGINGLCWETHEAFTLDCLLNELSRIIGCQMHVPLMLAQDNDIYYKNQLIDEKANMEDDDFSCSQNELVFTTPIIERKVNRRDSSSTSSSETGNIQRQITDFGSMKKSATTRPVLFCTPVPLMKPTYEKTRKLECGDPKRCKKKQYRRCVSPLKQPTLEKFGFDILLDTCNTTDMEL